jgi:hypothetical protein
MTHDELVDIAIVKDLNKLIRKQMKAIDAVFELHKSVQSYMFEEKTCSHCSSEEDRSEILYPCQTIQAIEKELG